MTRVDPYSPIDRCRPNFARRQLVQELGDAARKGIVAADLYPDRE